MKVYYCIAQSRNRTNSFVVVRQRVYHHYFDWENRDILGWRLELQDDTSTSSILRGPSHEWRFLLSICRTIREELLDHLLCWRRYLVIIQPSFTHNLNFALSYPFRKVYIQIIHGSRRNGFPSASFEDVQNFVREAVSHATLEQIELVVDVESLETLLTSAELSNCSEHESQFWRRLNEFKSWIIYGLIVVSL